MVGQLTFKQAGGLQQVFPEHMEAKETVCCPQIVC